MSKARVLLADDHRILAEGLRSLLEPEFELVGIVEDGRELIAKANQLQPDVIVADITMPSLNGIEAIEQLKKAGSNAKVVFLTMHHDVMYANRAFEAGASGFVLKHSAPDELLTAIRQALKGRTYVTPMIAGELMNLYKSGTGQQKNTLGKLTSRQREVLQLLAEGKSAKEVAGILHISTRTVEFHKYHIMEELGIKTGAELVQFAIRHGIISI
ncbi:MAG: response regulator transcription factor [Sedimentisphaerales bacterium]|nr:response regulator transcription factor [Sedimentisphaerales bacterium]